ncbi:DUF1648 domain-containing protein [Propioniciclava soli]|uniref:DUF1648 domain-containing protein n=1 Tax=Propioniciclava soli TaxID=2775081 RepID=UPI001E48EECC|nr:DUF1648 domain-containing protein [Propioniciclava soli]
MITSFTDLTPATRGAALAWLDAATAPLDPELADAVRDELAAALCAELNPEATPADVAAFAAAVGPVGGEEGDDRPGTHPGVGTFAGIPYDVRPPTVDRLKRAWWNPASDRLWSPRVFGAGWDLNAGALAVRLGLIEPDAEDEPFTHTPDAALTAGAAVPLALAASVVAHYAVRGRSLPAELPAHWNLCGTPDRWTPKRRAATTDLALAVTAAGAAVAGVAGRRPRPMRAGTLAATSGAAALAAGLTVARSLRGGWWIGPGLAALVLGAPAAVLVGLARAGRAGEQRRDLGRGGLGRRGGAA